MLNNDKTEKMYDYPARGGKGERCILVEASTPERCSAMIETIKTLHPTATFTEPAAASYGGYVSFGRYGKKDN